MSVLASGWQVSLPPRLLARDQLDECLDRDGFESLAGLREGDTLTIRREQAGPRVEDEGLEFRSHGNERGAVQLAQAVGHRADPQITAEGLEGEHSLVQVEP